MISEEHERLSRAELDKAARQPVSREDALLSAAFIGPALAWALQFALNYGLVYPAVSWQSKTPLHLIALAAACVALLAIVVGVRGLGRAKSLDGAERDRVRFMALCSCVTGGFFLLVIFAQSLPLFMLELGKP